MVDVSGSFTVTYHAPPNGGPTAAQGAGGSSSRDGSGSDSGLSPAQQVELAAYSPSSTNTPQENYFFDVLYQPIDAAALQLHTQVSFILGLAAFESGWYNAHNQSLNNPLGLTAAGGNNLSFSSVQSAISYFEQQFGPQINSVNTPEAFIQGLEGIRNGVHVPGWHVYNTVNSGWSKELGIVIGDMQNHIDNYLRMNDR